MFGLFTLFILSWAAGFCNALDDTGVIALVLGVTSESSGWGFFWLSCFCGFLFFLICISCNDTFSSSCLVVSSASSTAPPVLVEVQDAAIPNSLSSS